jgi:uncharacterized membrane protein YadS
MLSQVAIKDCSTLTLTAHTHKTCRVVSQGLRALLLVPLLLLHIRYYRRQGGTRQQRKYSSMPWVAPSSA